MPPAKGYAEEVKAGRMCLTRALCVNCRKCPRAKCPDTSGGAASAARPSVYGNAGPGNAAALPPEPPAMPSVAPAVVPPAPALPPPLVGQAALDRVIELDTVVSDLTTSLQKALATITELESVVAAAVARIYVLEVAAARNEAQQANAAAAAAANVEASESASAASAHMESEPSDWVVERTTSDQVSDLFQ